MRLRPATPLTLFFLIAFVLLLLSTLSTPVIKSIPLGSYRGTDYGVFGYCNSTGCSNIQIGYPIPDLSSTSLTDGSRHTLSSILIVHPVAAFMTLVCTVLAAASHFRGPSHSPRYLLFLLVLTFPTLLISLLAFLVDILLLIPHMAWGGWIVLAATIIITICSVLTCAMRRTLVSRKARKRRIAENADMNGDNFYAMQATQQQQPLYPRAESPPPMDGPNAANNVNKLPQFATFQVEGRRANTNERIPLNAREPSDPTQSALGQRDIPTPNTRLQTREDTPRTTASTAAPAAAMVAAAAASSAAASSAFVREQPRQETVSPINDTPPDQRFRRQPSRPRPPPAAQAAGLDGTAAPTVPMPIGAADPRDQQAPPPSYPRGRGGYPPPRGQYPPRAHPSQRGGYGRDAPRNGPPPSWNGAPRGMAPRGMVRGRAPPPGYPRRPMPGRRQPSDGAEYPGGPPIPMPYAPTSPTREPREWVAPPQRFSGESPRLPSGEPFAINAPYPGRSSTEGQRWQGPERRSLDGPNVAADYNRQPGLDQRVAQATYGYGQGDESYRRDPNSNAPGSPTSDGRNPNAPQPYSGYERGVSDGQQRRSASYGYGGSQPHSRRSEDAPAGSAPVSSPPVSDPYAGPPSQPVEIDTNNSRPIAAELDSQGRMPTVELDSRELGAQAPLGEHSHGMYLPRNAWQQNPVELGDSSPRGARAAPYSSPTAKQPTAELPARTSPQEETYGDSVPILNERRPPPPRPVRAPSDAYVEDVEPRFASDVPDLPVFQLPPITTLSGPLIPRGTQDPTGNLFPAGPLPMDPSNRSDNRSPAHSEASNFTSISQRQINPNWRPAPGPGPMRGPAAAVSARRALDKPRFQLAWGAGFWAEAGGHRIVG